eukprot:378774-Prymnesium_polylepis.1
MCSYNAVNGVPSCANDWLLDTVARENWGALAAAKPNESSARASPPPAPAALSEVSGSAAKPWAGFDGYITSDCDADNDVYFSHHYTATPEEAVKDVLRAGTDVDCGGFVSKYAQSALDKGTITVADMDARLKMQFRVRFRLGHFDPAGPLDAIGGSEICSHYSLALSQSGVTQSAALLKNDAGALPLERPPAGSAQTIAVIGPNALLSKSDAGYYGPRNVCGGHFYSARAAFE